MIKRRSSYFAAVLCAVLCLSMCLSGGVFYAFADETQAVKAELIKTRTDAEYYYLPSPSSIAASETNIYVTTLENTAVVFTSAGVYTDTLTFPSAADKVAVCGTSVFTLRSGTVFDAGAGDVFGSDRALIDCSAFGGTMYALNETAVLFVPVGDGGEINADNIKSAEYTLPENKVAKSIAATEGGVFVAVSDSRGNFLSDVYFMSSDGAFTCVFERAPFIERMTSPESGVLVTLQSGELCRYELKNGRLIRTASHDVRGIRDIAAGSDKIYTLGGDGSVSVYSTGFEGGNEIVASASSSDGFFRAQSNISTRKSALMVSDFGNDRVVKISDKGFETVDYDFIQPMSAVTDNLGNVYVAHNMDNIAVFDHDLAIKRTVVLQGAIIDDLKFDPLNNLYASTLSGTVYALSDGGEKFEPVAGGESGYTGIAVAPNGSTLYGMNHAAKEIRTLKSDGSKKLFSYGVNAVAFTVDIESNFYLLCDDGKIVKYFADGGYSESDVFSPDYESGFEVGAGANRIALSGIENSFLSYGDIIVSDTIRHCIKKISAESFGVKVIDSSFVPPEFGNQPSEISDERIVRTALVDMEVYEKPMEMTPIHTIAAGRKVLVISYDTEVGAFARVFADDTISSRGVVGYVYKAQMSAPFEYSSPVAASVTVYNDNTPLYKLPSRNAPILEGYSSVSKGSKLELVEFVSDYCDDYENARYWYRVKIGAKEGYIAATDVSVNNFDPVFIRPQTNAVILSVDGSTGAPLYNLEDGKYALAVVQPLLTGTRVEVVGTFDASEPYTLIKYYDETRGTLTGYVQTMYLKYDGVGILPLIAVILLLLTVCGIIIAVVWRNVANKKKLTKA